MTYPSAATIIEVGPRDGFQNIETFIETPHKLEIIRSLIRAGVMEMEITSFVNPKAVPQMADAAGVATAMLKSIPDGFREIALVPNFRGAQSAWESGVRTVSYVVSVSEAHNMANVRCTPAESMDKLRELRKEIPELSVRVDLATSFGCPFEGEIAQGRVLELLERALECGAVEIVLCDTIGVANPAQTEALGCKAKALCGKTPLALHMHDTRGMGLANIIAGMQAGINRFETAAGGLGGCPFAPGAAGNTATEDAVNMLHAMGIETGISLDGLMETVSLVKQYISPEPASHMSRVPRGEAK